MATCPKCGYKLKFSDWKPECPKCGINLVYYGMEEGLQADADEAECDHARLQKRLDRLKASFIGSPLAIARIVLSLLPLGPLFLTLCAVTYSGPFIEQTTTNVNALTLYNFVSSMNFDSLFAMFDSAVLGKAFIFFAISISAVLISAVLILVSLISLVAACGPKGNIRNITLDSVMIILAALSAYSFTQFSAITHSVFPEFFSGSLGIGAYIYIAALDALLILNIVITVKGTDVKYKQCYVGGIPYEEYLELVKNGTDTDTIREMMADALLRQEIDEMRKKGTITAEEEAELLGESAESTAENAEENSAEEAAEETAEETAEESSGENTEE